MERRDFEDTELPEAKPKRRFRLVAAALIVLAVLLGFPLTRLVMRGHLAMLFARPTAFDMKLYDPVTKERLWAVGAADPKDLERTAASRPDSLPDQFAAAVIARYEIGIDRNRTVPRLQELTSRFADRPALYAAILRYSCHEWNGYMRKEEKLFDPEARCLYDAGRRLPPAEFESFDSAAAAGERLDPDNAYFSLMRAAGRFVAKRDDEALASLHRASRKHCYEDYLGWEESSRYGLVRETYGERGAFARQAACYCAWTPGYSVIERAATVAVAKAMAAEKRGDRWAGLAIRRDVMQAGSLMRSTSRSMSGVRLGVQFVRTAVFHPGGKPDGETDAPAWPENSLDMTWVSSGKRSVGRDDGKGPIRRADAFYAYLRGLTPSAPVGTALYIEQEAERKALPAFVANETEAARRIARAAVTGDKRSVFDKSETYTRTTWWAVGLIAAANAFWMAVLTLTAVGLLRIRWTRGVIPFLAIAGVLAASAALLWYGQAFWAMGVVRIVSYCGCQTPDGFEYMELLKRPILTTGAALCVPGLCVLLLAFISILHRVPISTGVLRGLKGVGVPVACVLTLIYGGIAIQTARLEARDARSLDRAMTHEGRYLADLVGLTWPGSAKP